MLKTAIILSAGRGTRLKPITNHTPKAMCQIHGLSLLEHHIVNLARAGIQHIVINHAYLGGAVRQVKNKIKSNIKISFSPEPPGGLETAGGITNALGLIGDDYFVAVNADIYTKYDFEKLSELKNNLAHIVLVPQKPNTIKDFGLSYDNFVTNNNKEHTYAGIACYCSELFRELKPDRHSVTPLLRKLANENKLQGELYTGPWINIDSIENLQLANKA